MDTYLDFDSKFNWVAVKLTAIIIFIFVLQVLFPHLTDIFVEVPSLILSEPWRVVTHIFLHATNDEFGNFMVSHLLYNMFALALFGSILEKIIGWRRFLSLFFISGIVAGIGSAGFMFLSGTPNIASLGASGAVFGIIGALAILRPHMIVYIGFPMPMIFAAAFWALLDVIGLFNPFSPTNNSAHLFGLLFGIIFALAIAHRFGEPLFIKKRGSDVHISEGEFEGWEEKWMHKKKKKG